MSRYPAKQTALAKHLGCKVSGLDVSSYDPNVFSYGNEEWRVLTDSEADTACAADIWESAWSFNTDFVVSFCRLDWDAYAVKAFQKMQGELCESASPMVLALVSAAPGGFARFVEEAISADGRGHFLSGYDGNEVECGKFYAYRTN